jgi:hypothetical protein
LAQEAPEGALSFHADKRILAQSGRSITAVRLTEGTISS